MSAASGERALLIEDAPLCGRVSDLLATNLQTDGWGTTTGLTLADVFVTAESLGLHPANLVFVGSKVKVLR